MKKLILMLAAGLMLTSCVSKKKLTTLQDDYNALQTSYNTLQAEHQQANITLAENRATINSLEERLKEAQAGQQQMQVAYTELKRSLDTSLQQSYEGNVNISKLVDEINASNRFIHQLIEAKDRSDSLNMVLTNNLTRSLTQQEMQEVDVQVLKGVVYISLADNMLYESGSFNIHPRAAQTLSKIAKIIMDYPDYDVLIEGNTDNVPISKTGIRNNWDLSCLRAASVVMELQTRYGVDPKRLTAGGRGEYNPIAKNDTQVGRQRNRRTQIIITPKLDQFMDLIEQAPAEN